jgi:Leucine-rich repeat (LRR) protein
MTRLQKTTAINGVLLLLASHVACSQQLSITNISSPASNVVSLGWTSPTDRYIVAQCADLRTGQFQYVGAVLSTNCASFTNESAVSFFRIRAVKVADFPDPLLAAAVSNAIVKRHQPGDMIYDIDLTGITNLVFDGAGISNASGLSVLSDFLVSLSCWNNELTNLDFSGFTKLDHLECPLNELTNLDLTGCTNLDYLRCSFNLLTNLDLSDCTNLKALYCYNHLLASLDLSGFAGLSYLHCYENQLTNLNLAGCTNLGSLHCDYNLLTNLDLTGFAGLNELYCHNNQLTNINLTGCTSLDHVHCGSNQLTNLGLPGCTNLIFLTCLNNQLTNLDLSGCTNLRYLGCENNQLTNLDLTDCTNLVELYCGNNQLTDISSLVTNASRGGLGSGDKVWLSGNPLSQFAVTNQIPILQNIYGVIVYYP